MENDGGLDELFGALGEDDAKQPEPPEQPGDGPARPGPARSADAAALNAAFIEAATAPQEPIPAPAVPPAPPAPAHAASPGPDPLPDAPAPPLTRRELRERLRAQGEAATGAVETQAAQDSGPAAESFPAFRAPEPVSAPQPVVPPDASAPQEPAPADPAVADAALAALAAAAPPQAEAPPAQPAAQASAPRAGTIRQRPDGGFPIALDPRDDGGRGRRRSGLRWLAWFLPLVIVLGGLGAGAWWAWSNYEPQIRQVLGIPIQNDYEGTGNGEEVIVTILPEYIGEDVARVLHDDGVTMTWDAFYDLLIDLTNQGRAPTFQPGNYRLQKQMSAQAALDALMDPANRITSQVVIPEGSDLPDTLQILAATTGLPLADFEALAAQPDAFGVPNPANTLEGWLYPATYDLDGTETAQSLLQRLVDTMIDHLDALGIPADQRYSFLTLASIVQKESGPMPGDMAKVARVFDNRIEQGMKLESDATVTYGTCVWGPANGRTPPDTCGSVWLNQADIDDASNPYNTRANEGLPLGPISMPGEGALEAVANPAEGDWLFFVAVDLKTGETVFSNTIEEHDAAIEQLNEWCEASAENASYCA